MAETSTEAERSAVSTVRGDLDRTHVLLKVVYGLFPIVAGLDKFANVLTTWADALPVFVASALPVEPTVFMYVVGVVEIVAGLVVLSRFTEYGAYLVAGWLTAIAVVLLVNGVYAIAIRDLWIAVGAVALAQIDAARGPS